MDSSPETHRELEYHLRQAFLTAESETAKFHIRTVAALLQRLDDFGGLGE